MTACPSRPRVRRGSRSRQGRSSATASLMVLISTSSRSDRRWRAGDRRCSRLLSTASCCRTFIEHSVAYSAENTSRATQIGRSDACQHHAGRERAAGLPGHARLRPSRSLPATAPSRPPATPIQIGRHLRTSIVAESGFCGTFAGGRRFMKRKSIPHATRRLIWPTSKAAKSRCWLPTAWSRSN